MNINFVTSNPEFFEKAGMDRAVAVEVVFGESPCETGRVVVFDHHGMYSNRESAAEQGAAFILGGHQKFERFFVTGAADADACFCIAALSGILTEAVNPRTGARLISDEMIREMAEVVGVFDIDPIGREFSEWGERGKILCAWHLMMKNSPRDALSFYKGAALFRDLLSDPAKFKSVMDLAVDEEDEVRKMALEDMNNSGGGKLPLGNDTYALGVNDSRVFGFNAWYGRKVDGSWQNPIVAARTATGGNITIGCPKMEVAEKLFGPGGLKNVWAVLSEKVAPGFGGRETVGGSPRGRVMTEEELAEVVKVLADLAIKE